MAYWDTLTQYSPYQAYQPGKPRSTAFAAQYPLYEQVSPQYPYPNAYFLAQQGFATNTLIYACIDKRMRAISSAPLKLYNTAHELPKVVNNDRTMAVIATPNERMDETLFWQATSIYLDIAGFAAWEIERNKVGEPLHLWPMRPDWCSFLRGSGRPLRAIRYQPYGLPYQDVDIDNVLLFQYFDPRFPMLKGYSPTMAALKDIGVDNGLSNFLYSFIMQGAKFSGLLTTDQDLDDIEAERIRTRWKEQHGGVDNWNDIAVLGRGATYQNISMNFKDMAFPDLDGRIEARICMAFQMPPVLLGAKVGLNAATNTNYQQARRQWYEEWVNPQWAILAKQTQVQMFREPNDTGYSINRHLQCEFQTTKISALQEDRDLAFRRGISAARANVLTRDESRKEMGYDPIDNAPVFVGQGGQMSQDDIEEDKTEETADTGVNPDGTGMQSDGTSNTSNDTYATDEQTVLEEKRFFTFANRRKKEGKIAEIAGFKFFHVAPDRQLQLLREVIGV